MSAAFGPGSTNLGLRLSGFATPHKMRRAFHPRPATWAVRGRRDCHRSFGWRYSEAPWLTRRAHRAADHKRTSHAGWRAAKVVMREGGVIRSAVRHSTGGTSFCHSRTRLFRNGIEWKLPFAGLTLLMPLAYQSRYHLSEDRVPRFIFRSPLSRRAGCTNPTPKLWVGGYSPDSAACRPNSPANILVRSRCSRKRGAEVNTLGGSVPSTRGPNGRTSGGVVMARQYAWPIQDVSWIRKQARSESIYRTRMRVLSNREDAPCLRRKKTTRH